MALRCAILPGRLFPRLVSLTLKRFAHTVSRVTFSIVAADPGADEVAVAVQSKFLAVGSLVSWARGGIGAVATQALADVSLGPRGLDLLAGGMEPAEGLERLLDGDEQRETRQVGLVDARGRAASFTGAECIEFASSVLGEGFACQGNIMATDRVVPAMAEAYRAAEGPLAERLLEALRAAKREGGDRRGQESAVLLVAKPGGGDGGEHSPGQNFSGGFPNNPHPGIGGAGPPPPLGP